MKFIVKNDFTSEYFESKIFNPKSINKTELWGLLCKLFEGYDIILENDGIVLYEGTVDFASDYFEYLDEIYPLQF